EAGSVPVRTLDALRGEANEAAARVRIASDRAAEAKRAVESATTKVDEAERAKRQANGNAKPIQDAQVAAAKAALELARLEQARADREVNDAQQDQQVLDAAVERATERERFTLSEKQEFLTAVENDEQLIDSQKATAESNLNFAQERRLDAQRRVDASPSPDEQLQAELRARDAWVNAYRRETEVLADAKERLSEIRSLWDTRFRVLNEKKWAKSGEATAAIRQIAQSIDSDSKFIDTRLADVRQMDDRVRRAMPTDGTLPSRWQAEEQNAIQHRLGVLEAERRRLSAEAALVANALADAKTAEAQRTFIDHVRSVGRAIAGIWTTELFAVKDSPITVGTLVVGLILLFAGFWIARFLSGVIGKFVLRRIGLNEGAAAASESILFYVLLLTIALFALRLINVPLTVFTVLGGALAIGIGFGSQNLMNNFISGLIMLAERPIRVGDLIQLDDVTGTVQHIGARSTRLLTPTNIDVIVPNSTFLESRVTNWTLTEDKIRTSVKVGVAYGSPTRDVIRLMKKAADDHGKVLAKPPPLVLFIDFGDNSLMFELVFWLRIKVLMDRRMIESDLRLRINELFKEAGITIAFPQRDIHVDGIGPLDVRVLPAQEVEGKSAAPTNETGAKS
ncbi:MAG: mechanosensitive ion channel, partial [Phycisphaerales bacterium]|nr:mechanosensitive ion channel [Phycisphaerales bacterium]